ncbi:Methionine synthase reductase [Phytophthora ramorum]|uniref:Methionine synthase reductase n=1 Tax=Phytophthora ramorum TaxID=164328 RepID=UPI0030AF19DC|nr:Methionine synthase reductase [Phytophthora ramorum]
MGIGDDDTTDTQTAPRRRRFWWSHQVAVSSITHLDVFYGSRTGTAQALATELAQKAVKRGVVVSLNEMNAFDPTHFDEDDAYHSISRASVFVISTYYAGPAPNAESFIQWLRLATEPVKRPTIDVKSSETTNSSAQTDHIVPLPPSKYNRVSPATSPSSAAFQHSPASQCIFHLYWKNLFGGNGGATKTKRKNLCARLQYAVFGVGNSTYLTFNAMGKLVDARLQALGALRLCPLGLGDVSNNINMTFSNWEGQLLQQLAHSSTEMGDSVPTTNAKATRAVPRPLISARSAAQLTTPRRCSELMVSTQSQGGPQQRPNSILRRSSSVTTRSTGREGHSTREHFDLQPVDPLSLTVLDLSGRPVRLRFRCRYLTEEAARVSCSSILPGNTLGFPGKAACQSAEHVSQSWFTLKSLSILQHSGTEDYKHLALLRLSIEDPALRFAAADSFGFFPPNAAELVDNVAQQLGFDLNAYIEVLVHGKDSDSSSLASVESTSESIPFPNVCTVRTVLTNFLELRTISREFVRLASGFVSAPKEHELLETLSSTDGAAAFRQHFTLTKGGVLKLLELAPSLRIPFEVLINITPLIKPRFHLTATPPLYNGRELDIVVPLREQDDTDGLVATNWQYLLTRPEPGQHLNGINIYAPSAPQARGFFAESGFTVPSDRSAPMIMIAEGIGVVPFHALVQQRQREDATGSPIKPPARHSQGKNLLFLGCTNRNSLLFEPELLELEKKGAIELHIAFSADAESPKQLVHNLVDGNWQQIRTLMSSSVDSRLYVCGEAAMVRDIRNLVTLNCDDNTNGWCEAAAQSRRYIQIVVP